MSTLELRPLTLGELLDRTFFLYRRHFLLFIGISAIPHSFYFVANLAAVLVPAIARQLGSGQTNSSGIVAIAATGGALRLLGFLVGIVAFCFSAGASVYAVAEIYAGRTPGIRQAFASVGSKAGTIFGVMILGLLLIVAGLIAFIIPMFYLACRVSISIQSAVLEDLGPAASIRRSFALTRNFAGRAFMIYFLYFSLIFGIVAVLQFPFVMLLATSAKQPHMMIIWTIFVQVGGFLGGVFVSPVSTIGFSLFYYDLRVRKEAFDLQLMMQSIGADPSAPPISGGVPSMFGRDAS